MCMEILDTLLYNGKIYTMKAAGDTVEAIGIQGGKIVFAGSSEEAGKYQSRIKYDLKGASVIPGLADAHMHMYAYCQNQTFVNLEHAKTMDELCDLMRQKAEKTPEGTWIKGVAFDQNKLAENRMPTREDLDKISTKHPILIRRVCLHAAVVNSKALELAGVDENYPQPTGGIVEKDKNGMPNGVFREQATKIFDFIIPDPLSDKEVKNQVYQSVLCDMHAKGITNIHTYAAQIWNYEEDIDYYKELADKEELGVRITVCLDELFDKEPLTEEDYNSPYRLVQQGAYKLFTDGSLGSRSAALGAPYTDDPGNSGFMTCSQEALNEKIFTAYHKGLQCAVHAIGDVALDATLTAIENSIAREKEAGADEEELAKRLPFRIIHVQIINEKLLARMKKLPVVLDIQPIFLATDWSWIEDRLGAERMDGAYAWNTLQQAGLCLTGSSDCPVESYSPMPGIYAAVSRCGMDGEPKGGYQPAQKLSRFDAVALYTRNPHYATGQEDVLGLLQEGYFADLVVLDRDIFEIPEREILETKVTHTFVAGKLVYGDLS